MFRSIRKLILTATVVVIPSLLAGAGYTSFTVSEVERLFPAQGEFVDTGLGRQHYVSTDSIDTSDTATMVLLHGASSNLREFEHSLTPVLQDNYRVLAFDRPGYGYSERDTSRNDIAWASPEVQADVLHEALVKLDVKQPVLVGHSWSGALVMAYALKYPQHTRAVVLLGGATHAWQGGVAWHIMLAQAPVIGPLFTHTLFFPAARAATPDALAYIYDPEPVPAMLSDDIGLGLSLRPTAYAASARDVARLSNYLKTQSQRYDAIRVPILFISGADDQVVPAWNHAHRFKDHPAATLIELPKVGHGLHRTQAKRIGELIKGFVATLPADTRLDTSSN